MQVATLFRESATLLGASMEAGELHGLKMHAFAEGSLKQEAAADDGYETGVDHFDIRASNQGDQGKINQNNLDQQQMQTTSHLLQAHHNVALSHGLFMRRAPESGTDRENLRIESTTCRLDSGMGHSPGLEDEEDRRSERSDRERRMSSLENHLGGNSGHDGHLSAMDTSISNNGNSDHGVETTMNNVTDRLRNSVCRLGCRESGLLNDEMEEVGQENRINAMAVQMDRANLMRSENQTVNNENFIGNGENRIGNSTNLENHENHMICVENRLGQENHLNTLESRLVAQGNHLSGLENRLRHNMHMNNLDKRLGHREIYLSGPETRPNGRENCTGGLDGCMGLLDGGMTAMNPGRILPHETRLLDNHLSSARAHENHLNGLETRLDVRDGHLGLQEPRMSAHGQVAALDHRDPISSPHGEHVGLRMGHGPPHDHLQSHAHVQGLHHPHHPHHVHHPHRPPHQPHSRPHSKCDSLEDPYSFVEDDPTGMGGANLVASVSRSPPILLQSVPKKRGRKKKIKPEDGLGETVDLLKKENGLLKPLKERKKHDRFNGMPEEEVVKRTLPDHLTTNLDIVIIGINPGLFAAYKGHHYAGPGNHFWKCLYLSGLTPEPMTADDDYKLLSVGIGFTNMVARATKGSADLTRKEIKEGSQILLEKLQKFKPKIAVFNGKLIYEVFSGNKDFNFGRQPDFVDGTNTYMWVMPSSSARCAQLPRAADKVPFYAALKKFRDYLNGLIAELDENEVVFNDQKLKTFYEAEVKIESKDDQSNYFAYSRSAGNELTDLSNSAVKKEAHDPGRPEKKKRGRPKKIRTEGGETLPKEKVKKEKAAVEGDAPKKKRGRPKKIKTEANASSDRRTAPQSAAIQNGVLNVSEHTNSSNPASTCFSPPIQSPSGFCQGFSPAYASQAQSSVPQQYNPKVSSPAFHPSPHHPSPLPAQYSQSPPPPASQSQSQPFTHSDLSSEISAAISSEHLGSPPPTSPSLGPPDFEPPTSMPDEATPGMSVKEEPDQECRFSSPAPSESAYRYRGFPDAEMEHKNASQPFQRQPSPGFPAKRASQDVASKSLSGLESLVDQIPSIAEGSTGSAPIGPGHETFDSQQHSSQYDEYLGYSGYAGASGASASQSAYPTYTSGTNYSTAGYFPPSQNSFSVSSLANSASHGHESQVASSFSMSSLASNYGPGGYPNLMSGPHLVVPQPSLFPAGMNMTPNYQYHGQYPGQYSSASSSFPYSPHALHVPSPNYPPYGPYANSSYPQPYLANHVLDRIKQERMDIGFSGF